MGGALVRTLGRTWRLRDEGSPLVSGEPNLCVFLHGHILLAAFLNRDQGGVTMVSEHRDGEVIAQVVRRLGYTTARGSSTRGGAKAFRQMVQGSEDRPWGITPDGPRGPSGKVHPGVIQLSAESCRPIWPLGYAVSRGRRLSSWDRFVIPYPFSRIVQHVGRPLIVPPDIDRKRREELAKELEGRMEEANQEAERSLAKW
jgi:lysophospholipid acyltransferase (LPLAT)-like uncharacterized protein